MKTSAIAAAAAVLFAAVLAHAQSSSGDDRSKSRTSISYGGGGIRGNSEVVADGVLATPAEARDFQGEAGFLLPPPQRTRSLVPGIEVLKPAPQEKPKGPFVLAVRFNAPSDARIDPSTLKVLYGAGRLDITERIAKVGQVTAQGFTVQTAQLPPGRHQLVFQVRDDKQRVLERDLRLEVE